MSDECKCARCTYGDKEISDMEEESLKTIGWYAHHVYDDDNMPFNIDFHTHGFAYKFHPDIQIVLPIDREFVRAIFFNIYDEISKGKKFNCGEKYSGIIKNGYDVTFTQVDEHLIRLILPDEKNNLDKDTMDCPYRHQYDILPQECSNF
jgi:hypothetical protein